MDELLTDMVPYSGDPQVLLLWDNFTNPVTYSLQRLLSRFCRDNSWQNGISYNHLVNLMLSDLTDTPYVGGMKKNQILEELRNVFEVFETQGADGWVGAFIDYSENETSYSPDVVDLATSLLELIKGIIFFYNDYREIDERTLSIIRARVPALLRSPKTLEELGQAHGVTRERIRQIENKYIDLQLGNVKVTNSFLQTLLAVLEKSQDESDFIARADKAELLEGEPLTVVKLKAILRVLGLEIYISRVEAVESQWDIRSIVKDALSQKARESRHKFGLIDLTTFTRETKSSDSEAFAAISAVYPRSIRAGKLVLARTVSLDTAFENAMGKQLLVFDRLEAETLLVGIDRQANYRQTPLIGSSADQVALIKQLAGDFPEYKEFRSNTLEDPDLSQTDEWMLELFRDSPTGLMHRNEITAAALRDGKNVNSIGIFLLFNSLIRSVGSAVMALADQEVDPEIVKQYATIARAAEEPTQLDFNFQGSEILLRFTPNINTISAGVLFPKAELRDMIKMHTFDVSCGCGTFDSTQQLRLRNPSFWTGFTGSIKHLQNHHGYTRGEEIQMLVNLQGKIATIQLTSN